MCLTCGCMDAHLEMGEANIRYEDVKAAADENGRSVGPPRRYTAATDAFAKDRGEHDKEYAGASCITAVTRLRRAALRSGPL